MDTEPVPVVEGQSLDSEVVSKLESGKKLETREEMLSRHRKEVSDLQNKEISMKKAAAKGSKAEQKAKKKQVEDEISQLSTKLKAKHAEELSSMGYNKSGTEGDIDNMVMAIAGASLTSNGSKMSKSAKRRGKRAQQEAEREQRIQEEQSNLVSDRMIEDEKLENKLKPAGLSIHEIKPDGHCLYRAVEHQLSLHSGNPSPHNYQELREMAAKYMREHAADFLPFFLSDTEHDSDDSSQRFENYCKEVESTAAWGGQLELGALAHSLKKHIIIYSGSFPDVEMGKEYKLETKNNSFNPSVFLSYHKHAYGLGEHYNSVVPSGV